MKSSEQIRRELLAALARLSTVRPEWRIGQMLANVAMTAGRLDPGGVWDLEDDEACVAARTLIEQYLNNESVAGRQRGLRQVPSRGSTDAAPPEDDRLDA